MKVRDVPHISACFIRWRGTECACEQHFCSEKLIIGHEMSPYPQIIRLTPATSVLITQDLEETHPDICYIKQIMNVHFKCFFISCYNSEKRTQKSDFFPQYICCFFFEGHCRSSAHSIITSSENHLCSSVFFSQCVVCDSFLLILL